MLFLLRLWLAYSLQMIPDEAYYWSWSRHPDWCYYDQPGMIAWLEYLSTQLTGMVNPFMARLPMLLLSLGATVSIYMVSYELFGSRNRAVVVAGLLNVIPVFFAGSFLVMHDTALIFFWILSCLFLVRLINTQRSEYFYLLAFTIAGAVYSKFTGVFFMTGLVIFVVLSPRQRKWLKNPHFYFMHALLSLLLSPIIWWNSHHGWVSYHAVLKLGTKTPASLARLADYVLSYHGAQFLIMSPLIYAALLFVLFDGSRWWLRKKDDAYLLCLAFSVPVLIYFSYLSFRSRVQPNWSVFGYPMALVLMVEIAYREIPALNNRWIYGRPLKNGELSVPSF